MTEEYIISFKITIKQADEIRFKILFALVWMLPIIFLRFHFFWEALLNLSNLIALLYHAAGSKNFDESEKNCLRLSDWRGNFFFKQFRREWNKNGDGCERHSCFAILISQQKWIFGRSLKQNPASVESFFPSFFFLAIHFNFYSLVAMEVKEQFPKLMLNEIPNNCFYFRDILPTIIRLIRNRLFRDIDGIFLGYYYVPWISHPSPGDVRLRSLGSKSWLYP